MQEFRPGDTINNRYKVNRKLGAGAMGSVYLCEDLVENSIKVALKVLISENLDDQDVWAKGEYEALTRLRHPNLARVYNFGKVTGGNDYFIVSEFIKGIDLYTATEYVRYDELNDVVVQICRALEYIHSQGYVHFDIKPDNILVTRHKTLGLKDGSKIQYSDEEFQAQNRSTFSKPSVKLIDFGLAEKITGSFSFAIKGTLNYLAPEIINGTTPDKRADLYSLGVTLYQCTNRDLPFYHEPGLQSARGQKRAELFENHMKKHPEYLRALLLKLLEEKPENRFQNAREVIQFLNKNSGQHFDIETKETQASYLYCPRLVGRKKELSLLKDLHERVFWPERFQGPSAARLRTAGDDEGSEEEGPAAQAPDAAQDSPAQDSPAQDSPARHSAAPDDAAPASASAPAREAPPTAAPPADDDLETLTSSPVARPGTPPLVVISGEMGVGKSRLLEEFQHYLKLHDVRVYTGNCYEGKSNAYQPFVEILREMVVELGPDSEVYRRFQPEILKLLPELAERQAGAREASRHYQENIFFIDHLSQFFMEAARDKPFIITINNLHWGDEATVELLGALVDRINEAAALEGHFKIMVVVSQRTDDRSLDLLKALLSRLKDEGRMQEVMLRRLKRAHLLEIIQTILNLNEVPAPFLDRLEERTGGNPLFVMETLKALHDEGILKNSENGWTIKAQSYNRIEIPHSLEELLLKRAQRLEPVKRQILEVMSVLNKPLSPKLLSRFGRFRDLPILVHLRDLEDAGMVSKLLEGGRLQFQIDQTKMQEILYANLDPPVRSGYHGEVGRVLADLYQGREEEVLEELAYHFQRSDHTDRALELAVRAGDRLEAIYAHDRAYEYYLYIIEKTENDPSRFNLWVETHEKLGDLCTVMGRYEVAEHSYDALLQDEVRKGLNPEAVSRAWRKKGRLFEIQGDYDSALRCYKEARNVLAQVGDQNLVDERTRVFNSIGWIYVCMGKYEKAMAISLEGLRLIQGEGEKIELAMIYSTIGSANYFKGNIGQAIEYHSRGLKIRENLENIPEVIVSLNNLGSAYLSNAEYGEALEHFKRALEASEEIGDPHGRAMTLHHLARGYFEVGQTARAEDYLQESLRLSRNYNMRHLNNQNYILLGTILRERRDAAKAEGNLFRALTAFSKQGNRWGLCTVLLEIVEVHRLRRNFNEAMTMAEEAYRHAVGLDIDYLKLLSLLAKAHLLRDMGERNLDTPLGLLKEALAAGGKVENPELGGRVLAEMGEVLVRGRRLKEARDHFRAAAEKFRAVLDRLPKDLRAGYQEKHKDKFSSTGGMPLPEEVPDQPAAAAPAVAEVALAPPRPGDVLEEVSALMRELPSRPPLEEFLTRLLGRLLAAAGAEEGGVLERRGDSFQRIAWLGPAGLGSRAGQVRADALQAAVAQRAAHMGRELAVLPFTVPDGGAGAVYLRGTAMGTDARALLVAQAFVNLVPVAFLTLPLTEGSGETTRAVEVDVPTR